MPILPVKEAVTKAKEHLSEMYQTSIDQLLLEEVQRSEDGTVWNVTISFPHPAPSPGSALQTVLGGSGSRMYKVVQLSVDDGSFVGLKIRKP